MPEISELEDLKSDSELYLFHSRLIERLDSLPHDIKLWIALNAAHHYDHHGGTHDDGNAEGTSARVGSSLRMVCKPGGGWILFGFKKDPTSWIAIYIGPTQALLMSPSIACHGYTQTLPHEPKHAAGQVEHLRSSSRAQLSIVLTLHWISGLDSQ